MEEAQLAAWLDEAQKALGADDPFVKAALGGQTPAAVAKQVIARARSSRILPPQGASRGRARGHQGVRRPAGRAGAARRADHPRTARVAGGEGPERRGPRRAEDRPGPLRRLRQDRLSRRELQPASRVRHRARLRGRHDARAVQDHVLRPLRTGRGVRREAAVQPARALARRPGEARPLDALQLRLHGRHDWRQFRQPGHQPQRRDLRRSTSTATSRSCRTATCTSTKPKDRAPSASTRRASSRACGSSTAPTPSWRSS